MLQKPFSLAITLFTCILLWAQVALPAQPSVHISAKPKWINPCPAYDKSIPQRDVVNGFFYRLIEEQINVEQKAHYVHVERQIVSEAGIQNASEISISFDPSYEQLSIHDITIWRDNKPQKRLSAKLFKVVADEAERDKFIYQGTYSAYCILDDIRKGDRIEYAYTLSGRNPIFGDHFAENIYVQVRAPVAHLYKTIFAAADRKLNFKAFNKVPKTNTVTKNGITCYSWENFQVPAATDYDNQPGWYTSYAYLQISDYNSWAEVADWALKINPTQTVTGKLAERVAAIKVQTGANKQEYFRAAVKLVQDEIRYTGIEMGEYSHRANDPEKVYNQRYGDCKDKSLLLVSILNAGGIEANMALISTYATIKTDQYLPSPLVFDHAVVRAVVDQLPVWVDATISYQRGHGTQIYFPQYGQGLILQPGSNAIADIPPGQTGKIKYLEEYFIPTDTTKVALDVTTVYTLNEADRMRSILADASMAETEKNYIDYYARIYPKVESADSITIYDSEYANEITIIEHYLIPGFAKKNKSNGRYEAGFYANFISEQLPDVNQKNKYPRIVKFPCDIDYTIRVQLSTGWSVEEIEKTTKANAYRFDLHVKGGGDSLVLNYKLKYLKSYIAADEVDQYIDDIKEIKDNQLSYSFSYFGDGADDEKATNRNYWMILLAVIVALAASAVFAYLYRIKTQEVVFEPGANFIPLGGWLIVVGIGLSLSILRISWTMINSTFFDMDMWIGLTGTKKALETKVLIVFEVVVNSILICYAVFCLIMFLNKRDILPRYIIWLYLGSFIFIVTDIVLAYIFIIPEIDNQSITDIVRAVVGAAIWVPYFRMSTRVRETFIVPYPHGNYTYVEWQSSSKNTDTEQQTEPED